jgi:hypothetical protein
MRPTSRFGGSLSMALCMSRTRAGGSRSPLYPQRHHIAAEAVLILASLQSRFFAHLKTPYESGDCSRSMPPSLGDGARDGDLETDIDPLSCDRMASARTMSSGALWRA